MNRSIDKKAKRRKVGQSRMLTPPGTAPSTAELPLYCDFSCPHAEFPPADAVGACRREQAVWCGVEEKYNSKNGKCLVSRK